jgi:hypothetical protein
VVLGTLWRHFQQDLGLTRSIYPAEGDERYSVWT